MKNLFKNLMLVAVAAMAFVACSQEGIEVNNLTKKTIVEGIASINTDDTRSGFVGSETVENEDGTTTTVYKSAWDGEENIKVFATEQGLETTAIINEDGKFTAEFEGELPENYFIAVCSPAAAWVSTNTFNIPTVQTPRTNSVDPAAHILSQQGILVSNGSADPFLMQHQVGYGKMTVNTPAEFVIDYVEVELNGVWYGSDKTLKYTINADNVEGNVFWFATDVVEVSDFTVTAYDAEGNAYTKSVTIPEGRELKFQYGRVSTFSVSNLEPTAPDLSKADYIATDIAWNADSSRFDFTLDGTSRTFGVYLNSANTNARYSTILEGDYTVDATKTPAEGKFAVYHNVYGVTRIAGDTGVASTMSVKYVNEQYYITIDYYYSDSYSSTSEEFTVAYYGIPTNWVAPGEELAEPTQLETPVVTADPVQGNQATLSWNAIAGAGSYTVTYSSETTTETTTVDTNQVILSLAWDTTYTVTVVANPADETVNYASEASTPVNVEVGSNPDAGGGDEPGAGDYITASQCMFYGDLMGAGMRNEFVLVSSDRNTQVFFSIRSGDSTSNTINPGTYTYSTNIRSFGTICFEYASSDSKVNGNVVKINSATLTVASGANGYDMTLLLNDEYEIRFSGAIK